MTYDFVILRKRRKEEKSKTTINVRPISLEVEDCNNDFLNKGKKF